MSNNKTATRKNSWVIEGAVWGGLMFVFMTTLAYLQGQKIDARYIGISLVCWTVGGFLFGLAKRYISKRSQDD